STWMWRGIRGAPSPRRWPSCEDSRATYGFWAPTPGATSPSPRVSFRHGSEASQPDDHRRRPALPEPRHAPGGRVRRPRFRQAHRRRRQRLLDHHAVQPRPRPARHAGRDLTVVSVFGAVGEYAAGRIDAAELLEVERRACPGAGSCGGMFTANTMSSIFEAMGMSLPYSSTMAAEDAEKAESAARSA